jgi:GDP-L-fucose synthase
MPTNLYGPNDNYDLNNSHVLPAMLRKFHLAKLAQQGDLAGIRQNEANLGQIPADVKAMIGLEPNAPISQSSVLSPRDSVVLWGTGTPKREFLYSDDMADACLYLLEQPESKLSDLFNDERPPLVNIGCGEDLSIRELAVMIAEAVGYSGKLVFDATKPDGTMQKLMDVSRMKGLGWAATTSLRDGILTVY